jgi:drug/metabolite transporter (DMT)-like permease
MAWWSIALVSACALLWDLGVVLQKRAADELPPLVPGKDLAATLKRFITSRRWMAGTLATAAGYGLFAYALTFTPVSVARSAQGFGFVVLALLSVFFLRHRLSTSEWAGVGGVTIGVVLLGISEPATAPAPAHLELGSLGLAVAAVVAVCGGIEGARRLSGQSVNSAAARAAMAGALLGLGDALTRALILELPSSLAAALGVIGPVLSTVYVVGFMMLSRAYQKGRALVVTAVSDLAARLVTLFVGVLALDEALPNSSLPRAERLAGFGLILVSTAALSRLSAEQLARSPGAREATS